MARVRKEPPQFVWTLLRIVTHLCLGMVFHIALMLNPVLALGPIAGSLLFEIWFLHDAGMYLMEKWHSGSKWSLGLAVMAWAPSDYLAEKMGFLPVAERGRPFAISTMFLLAWMLLAAFSWPKAGE